MPSGVVACKVWDQCEFFGLEAEQDIPRILVAEDNIDPELEIGPEQLATLPAEWRGQLHKAVVEEATSRN